MRIIPAIDIIDGKCVRLSKGDYDTKKIYNENPLEVAKSFEAHGIEYLHLVDLDGDLRIAFESGANQITGGSIAVKDRTTFLRWLNVYGPDKIILGADALYQKIGIKYVICTDISKDGMLEGPSFNLYGKLLEETKVHKTIVTGAGVEDFQELGIHLIASGGISEFKELPKLKELGCEGVIIGKAIYENRISLKQLENFMLSYG